MDTRPEEAPKEPSEEAPKEPRKEAAEAPSKEAAKAPPGEAAKASPREPKSRESASRKTRSTFVDRNSTDKGPAPYTRDRLAERSKEELIEMVLELKLQLDLRTTKLAPEDSWIPFDAPGFAADVDPDRQPYMRLPKTPRQSTEQKTEHQISWRVIFLSSDSKHEPIGLRVYGDSFIGRSHGGLTADFDLTEYDGINLGVSRHHALLRPTKDGLTLTDLESTNGTFVNGNKLSPGKSKTLEVGDLISLGSVHFSVKLLQKDAQKPTP